MHFADHVIRPTGYLTVLVYERGKLVEEWSGKNVVVAQSRTENAHLFGGDVTNRSISKIGFGTSGSAPSSGNTALTSPFIKTIDGVTYPTSASVEFSFSLSTAEGNGKAIMEFGLHTAAGILVARRVRSAVLNKTSDIALSGKWRIEF